MIDSHDEVCLSSVQAAPGPRLRGQGPGPDAARAPAPAPCLAPVMRLRTHRRERRHLPPHWEGGHTTWSLVTEQGQNVSLLNTVTRSRSPRRPRSVWAKIESLPCRGRRTLISHHDWLKIFSHSLWMMMGFRVIVIWKKRCCISPRK